MKKIFFAVYFFLSMAVVFLAWKLARDFFPANLSMRISLPILAAVLIIIFSAAVKNSANKWPWEIKPKEWKFYL